MQLVHGLSVVHAEACPLRRATIQINTISQSSRTAYGHASESIS